MRRPFFSVVIPTRNRPDMLASALQSILEQDFPDLEVIVSDNASNDDSARRIVQLAGDSRVRYVRIGSFVPHFKSWQFAVTQAVGDYIVLLADDDAGSPSWLSTISRLIRDSGASVITFSTVQYIEDSSRKDNGHIRFRRFSGLVSEVESGVQLSALYGMELPLIRPKTWNACYSRDVVSRVSDRAGAFYLPPSAEYTSSTMALAVVNRFLHCDVPLYVTRIHPGEIRSGVREGQYTIAKGLNKNYLREFPTGSFTHVPFDFPVFSNYRAESLLRVREILYDRLHSYTLSWDHYYLQYYEDLMSLERRGIEVSSRVSEFWEVIKCLSGELQASLRDALSVTKEKQSSGLVSRISGLLRSTISSSFLLQELERRVRGTGSDKVVIHGKKVGVQNTLECARKLDEIYRSV